MSKQSGQVGNFELPNLTLFEIISVVTIQYFLQIGHIFFIIFIASYLNSKKNIEINKKILNINVYMTYVACFKYTKWFLPISNSIAFIFPPILFYPLFSLLLFYSKHQEYPFLPSLHFAPNLGSLSCHLCPYNCLKLPSLLN